MTYHSTADEPSLVPRSLTVSVTSVSEMQACSIGINISPLNDHSPVIYLSGPVSLSINYSTSIDYSIFTVNRATVASDGVTISDGDVGAVVRSVQVELVMGGEGDRLVLNEELCMDSSESTCHLRYVRI